MSAEEFGLQPAPTSCACPCGRRRSCREQVCWTSGAHANHDCPRPAHSAVARRALANARDAHVQPLLAEQGEQQCLCNDEFPETPSRPDEALHQLLLRGPKHSVFMDGKQLVAGDAG